MKRGRLRHVTLTLCCDYHLLASTITRFRIAGYLVWSLDFGSVPSSRKMLSSGMGHSSRLCTLANHTSLREHLNYPKSLENPS